MSQEARGTEPPGFYTPSTDAVFDIRLNFRFANMVTWKGAKNQ